MERIRIGNDIAISWALFENNGATHLINAGGASVSLNCGGYTYLVPSFSVQGNVVSFIFPAEDQVKTGKYKIVLTERNESGLVSSYDVRDAFVLVPENEMLNVGYTQQKNVEITSVITHAAIANIKTISIVESEEEGGDNVVTFVLTDGSQFPMTVKNGSKGDKGDKGDQGIQGEKGDKGDTGARGPAGIEEAEVTVDGTTGTPAVEASIEEGVLSLAFSGLKGEKGDQGEPAVAVENYVTVEATAQTTAATDVLPATGDADTVYRVANWDGTQYDDTAYTEYGWYDGAYKQLATRAPGIDDEPTANSSNLVKSGGVASQISQLGKEIINCAGGQFEIDGTSANRSLILQGGFKKGDKVHIELTDDADSKRVTMYKDVYGGGLVGIMTGDTFDYDVDADFSAIVFYNDNYALGYTINMTIYRKGQVVEVRELIISDPIVDERTISTSGNLDNASRFSADVLDGYRDVLIKVENVTGVATKWSLYYISQGYEKLFDSTTFGEYVKATIPSTATAFGIYVFSSDVTTSGTIKVSYLFESYLDKRLKGLEDTAELVKPLFPNTSNYSGTTENRSLTINGDYKKGDVINITISNDSAQSHLFTLYQDVWGGKLIGRPTDLSFQYVAPNDFSAIVFYNDNSAAGYDVSISVEKQGVIKDLQDDVEDLQTATGTIDNIDRLITINENPLSVIRRDVGFAAMFLKWGFIGDSLSSGCHNVHIGGEATSVDFYDFSWGQFICRLCGTEGYNFSFGGQSALGWITNTKGDGVTPISDELKLRTWDGAKTNLKDAYTIAFGVNDVNVEASVGDASTDIGVYNPATDTDTNANTFAGHYAGVIQRIKSVQPKAKIFCITMPQGDQGHAQAYSEVIRSMADYFDDVYIIDLYTYAPAIGVDWSYRYRQQYHLNAAGYLWTAYEIMTYIDWIVRNNWRAFNNVAFIGTDYTES